MPSFNVTVPHDDEHAVVAERLKAFADKVRGISTVSVTELVEEWDDAGNLNFSFKAMGFKVSGRLETKMTAVHVQGTIPFAALPFRGAIEKEVAAKIREAIS